MTTDRFGIKQLYPTLAGGREWYSVWNNGHARAWTYPVNYDPDDPELYTKGSAGSYSTDGNGVIEISGGAPRLFIVDPARTGNWHNVEITVYGMRVADDNTADAGIQAFARTNHILSSQDVICDTRGYAGRFRYDGGIGFMKETKHGAGYYSIATVQKWSGGMPYNVWLGYKFVVYDLPDGNVKLELYLDETDGLNGGTWVKITEFIDNGSNFGVGGVACAAGIDPALRLTNSDTRPGSETGKPNLDIYWKPVGVGTNGLLFKKASIRTISVSSSSAQTISHTTNSLVKGAQRKTHTTDAYSVQEGQSGQPVAAWDFDENTGTTAYDSSGNNNNGAINGAAWVAGKVGSALQFDGIDDYINCGNGSSLNVSTITVMAWIKSGSVWGSASYPRILDKMGVAEANGYAFIVDKANNRLELSLPGANIYSNASVLSLGQWYHVAAVADGSNVRFYVNGQGAGVVASTALATTNTLSLLIGDRSGSLGTRNFNGTIDRVKIYNRALSPEEVLAEYNAGAGASYSAAHSTDCSVYVRDTKAHTTDIYSVVQAQQAQIAHETDSLVYNQQTQNHSTDSLIQATQTIIHDTDVLVDVEGIKTHSTDVLIKVQKTVSIFVGTPVVNITVGLISTATVNVTVVNQNNEAVVGAICQIGTIIETTGADGVAVLNDVPEGLQDLTITYQ